MKESEHLTDLINNYPSDIKAEVLIADLIEKGFTPADFIVLFNSSFKRRYSSDILGAEKYQVNSFEETLAISLARDGLYDLLPEGLFHASPDSAITSGKGMASDSKKETRIEEETRKFFLPFENEFFYQRVELELQERLMLQKLNENNLNDFFLDFWKIDRSLNRELIIRLSMMLPFVRKIVGDFEMTANCLGAILNEKVTQKTEYSSDSAIEIKTGFDCNECVLGNTDLGVNMIIGSHSPENCKLIRFSIGPLRNGNIESYMEDGETDRFIKCFCSYFIPLEMNVAIDVFISQEMQGFVLDPDSTGAIMGYSTII